MPDIQFNWGKPLSVGHLMSTTGSLRPDGTLSADTRTRSVVMFAGFHGAVLAVVYDNQDRVIATGSLHTYGVDGVMLGQSDRTDSWTENFGPAVGAAAQKVSITHSWNPQWAQSILNTIRVAVTVVEEVIKAFSSNGQTGEFRHNSMNDIAAKGNSSSPSIGSLLAVAGDGLDINAPLVGR